MSASKRSRRLGVSILIELLKLKAKDGFVQVKTTELGIMLGVSQQAASQDLKDLERMGLILRRKGSGNRSLVMISEKGLDLVSSFYSDLKQVLDSELEEKSEVVFHGRVFRGLGQAAHFISLPGYRRQFARLLNFVPYPGSLNIRLASPLEIYKAKQLKQNYDGIQLEGFALNNKEYSPLKCFKGTLNDEYQCALLFTDRTHYNESVLEIISPERLRDKLGLKIDTDTGESNEKVTVRISI